MHGRWRAYLQCGMNFKTKEAKMTIICELPALNQSHQNENTHIHTHTGTEKATYVVWMKAQVFETA